MFTTTIITTSIILQGEWHCWYASIKIELSGIMAEDSYPPIIESKQGGEGLAGVLLKYPQREGRLDE